MGLGIVSDVGSDVWGQKRSVIEGLQQSAAPQDRLDVQSNLRVNDKAFVKVDVNMHKVFAAIPTQVSERITYLSEGILSGRLQGSSVTLRL